MGKKRISQKDLAERLKVSISTVSRALQDSPEISIEMRNQVQELAEKMNYRPNPFAISLLKDTPRIIGIIVPDIVTHFYSSIISGINDLACKYNYSIIITTSYEEYEKEKQCIENLINIRVEGIIACVSQKTVDYSHFDSIADQHIPLVFFDRVCLPERFSSVVADNVQSATSATKHLIRRGAKRIGFIGGPNHLKIVQERKHGYLNALRENNILIEPNLVVCNEMTYNEGKKAIQHLLSLGDPPDAILAMNDTLAFAAMKGIKKKGLRIPNDIALIGYTDELHSNYVDPTLTAVTHQTYSMGKATCQLLLEHIQYKKDPKQIVIPTNLMIREST